MKLRRSPLAHAVSLALAVSLAATAHAQSEADAAEPEAVELDTVEVRVLPQGGTPLDSTQPVDVITGEQLDDQKEATLGETLATELGIHSTYFGPGAGRPIIRGLGGNRVRITEDGLSSLDAAALSPDHAVSAEPLLIDRIEILRGPANLLYGSTASGGVINLIDNRIPEQRQDFSAQAEFRANTAADERAGVVRLDGGIGAFQFHIDGFQRETDDYEIPGFALTAEELAELDAEERAEQEEGVLKNTAQESEGATIGVSVVGDWGFAGVAWKGFETLYGVPKKEKEEDDDDELPSILAKGGGDEPVSIDLDQDRYEFRAGFWQPVELIDEFRIKFARNEYQHIELEGDEIGTTFDVEGQELRLEARHAPIGRLSGVVGFQFEDTTLEAVGEEAFIPAADTQSKGLFVIEEFDLDPILLSAGLRLQTDEISLADSVLADGTRSRDFDLLSLSAGAVWRFAPDWQASANWQRSERAPTQEELFANGPHIATQNFEVGDPSLGKETSNNIDIGIHKYAGPFHFRADVFYNDIEDFVYLADTGDIEDGLPVQIWSQADAEFWGLEAEASVKLPETSFGDFELRGFGDTVDADIDVGNGNVPRLSPTRLGAGLDWHRGGWRGNVEFVRVFEVDDVAEFESETDGYNMLTANLAYRWTIGMSEFELFLKGANLLDEEQRVHTSFLKDVAPLPGINITTGLRARF
ncbi:TonB-dependent receptor [Wenzhouxiangella sp. XN79A]|uniref:TonB-dependent receptor n=1 Tax=Wenzhouxiangella sp. XN79A TaxID=2724193 RepID=UPI00144A6DC4|nr:TonB-dependent receptor [Wenzhouxiangella sp. XN79A]NKI34315.1 TonB-dependent receptor [Wenzhouxiangella sp. XN79A]